MSRAFYRIPGPQSVGGWPETVATLSWRSMTRTVKDALPRSVSVVAFFAVFLVAGVASYGQVTGRSSITGIVTDPMGAAVVNARVVVTEIATNVAHSANTNDTGYFEVDNINPGTYKVVATAQGFEVLEREGLTLAADARINVPLQMKVGNATEIVVVTGDVPLLNTETGSTGFVLSTRQVENLPASGANPMQLVTLYPGMQTPVGQNYNLMDTLSWNGVSKFGSTGYLNGNEWSVDGVPNMGNPRGNAIALAQEEVGEMKVEPVSFDASVGHTMGATITMTTKSGTNQLHGAIHQYYLDRSWAAMTHFQGLNYRYQQSLLGCADGSSDPKCLQLKYKQGQPGTHLNNGSYAVGGPVFIPKVYDGRNKAFFFVNVNNNLWTDASAQVVTIPTIQERRGDFSDMPVSTSAPQNWTSPVTIKGVTYPALCPAGTPYYGQYQIYNPFQGGTASASNGTPNRAPVCGNNLNSIPQFQAQQQIPVVATMTTFYNNLLPAPTNGATTGNNLNYTQIQPQTWRQFTGRGDYAISDTNHLFLRWTRAHYLKQASGWMVNNADRETSERYIQLGALGWDHVFNATTNMSVMAGASDYKFLTFGYPGFQQYAPSTVGLPSSLDTFGGAPTALPLLNVSNYRVVGARAPFQMGWQYYRDLSIGGALNRVQGRHSFRLGAEWRKQSFSTPPDSVSFSGPFGRAPSFGIYTFDNSFVQNNNGTVPGSASPSQFGLAYASLLLGLPSRADVGQSTPLSIRTPYMSTYLQDTWRVTSRFTVNLGVRLEYELGPKEQHNAMVVGWDPNATLPFADAVNANYQNILATLTTRANATTPDTMAQAQLAVLPKSLSIKGGPIYAGINGAPTRMFNNDFRILPRFAIAYELTPHTVIRAGYGMFADTINAHEVGGQPHSGTSGISGVWNGLQFSVPQDGYTAITTTQTSANYCPTTSCINLPVGQTPLSNPYPLGFNTPVGNALGAAQYLGTNPTIYDHNLLPTRAQRVYVGVQHQLGSSTMVEVAWLGSFANNITISQVMTPLSASFYAGGNEPNNASNALLGSQLSVGSGNIGNPFYINNLSSLATTNPVVYNFISKSNWFTQKNIQVQSLLRGDPQLSGSGLQMWRSVGLSRFSEFQANLTRRYARGLTVMAGLQLNNQHDADFFANPYDTNPTWRPSNNSLPYRITAAVLYELPFGKGRAFANSGILSKLFGGFQLGSSWERQSGQMIEFNNLFYIGDTSIIKLQQPVYVNNLGNGPTGYNYIQWLNVGNVLATYDPNSQTCTYTGTGFVTNPQCQPNGYNTRAFPTRLSSVRQQAPDTLQASLQRNFRLSERFSFEARLEAYNVLNRQPLNPPQNSVTNNQFGQVVSDFQNARWLAIQGRLRF